MLMKLMQKLRAMAGFRRLSHAVGVGTMVCVMGAGVSVVGAVPQNATSPEDYRPAVVELESQPMRIQQLISPREQVKAWFVQDRSSQVVSVAITFRDAGSISAEKGKMAVPKMLSNLLTEGAGNLPRETFQKMLYDNSIKLSATAGRDTFQLTIQTVRENLDKAMDLGFLAIWAPHLREEDMKRVRNQMVDGLKLREADNSYVAVRKLMETLFEDHPYAENPEGTVEGVESLTRADLYGFLKTRLAAENAVVTVVGNTTDEEIKTLLDKGFARLPATPFKLRSSDASMNDNGEVVKLQQGVGQAVVTFAQPLIKRDHPDYMVAAVMNQILGGSGGKASWLFNDVREEKGLVYGISTSLYPLKYGGFMMGSARTTPAQADQVIASVKAQWRRMAQTGPSASDLAAAKSYLKGALSLTMDNTLGIARALNTTQYFNLGLDYLDQRRHKIESVTAAQIQAFARKYLAADELTFVVVSPDPKAKPSPLPDPEVTPPLTKQTPSGDTPAGNATKDTGHDDTFTPSIPAASG